MMSERETGASVPITIDRTSPVPLYFQLAQYFESAIRSGVLKVGARLENEVQLAEMLGLSRPTVRAAFLYLANKGLVVRKRGAGTLVANERIDRNVELTSLYDDLAASGRKPATRVLKAEVSHASDQVAEALQLPERALVMSLERIRLADGEPMALMHNYLPAGLVQLNVEMLEQHGLYELLRASGIGLYSATQRMGAKNASASEARTLDETRGTALLTMERIAYDQAGRPVEFARHLYRASRYAFTTSFPRPEPGHRLTGPGSGPFGSGRDDAGAPAAGHRLTGPGSGPFGSGRDDAGAPAADHRLTDPGFGPP
jgi:DNA-binding GntR family transcriptional regulator